MNNSNYYKNIGIVVLNYITYQETDDFLNSLQKVSPSIKTIVVDNGSGEEDLNKLRNIVSKYDFASLIETGKNLGFAKGNNVGIKKLLNEGYKYIICSNNDIIIQDSNLFKSLYESANKTNSAIIGPQIITLKNENQNPYIINRPSKRKAYFSYYKRLSSLRKIIEKIIPPNLKKLFKKRILKENIKQSQGNKKKSQNDNTKLQKVFSVHGAFLMFCPPFFEYYDGFDNGTFLYCEELILSEMLFVKNLSAYYDPNVSVLHKEDRTSDIVFGGQLKNKGIKIAKQSLKYWYKIFYKKNNKLLKLR